MYEDRKILGIKKNGRTIEKWKMHRTWKLMNAKECEWNTIKKTLIQLKHIMKVRTYLKNRIKLNKENATPKPESVLK